MAKKHGHLIQCTYCQITPNKSTIRYLVIFNSRFERKDKILPELRRKIKVQNTRSSTPQLYGLPKIHKASAPLRPIVSSINSPTYNLSRYLADILTPLWGNTPHLVRNSEHFVQKISGLIIDVEDKLTSFDVKSLFTKVPIDLSLQIIRRRLTEDMSLPQRTTLDPSTIMELTELCLNQRTSSTKTSSLSRQKGQPWDPPSLRWWPTSSWRSLKQKPYKSCSDKAETMVEICG